MKRTVIVFAVSVALAAGSLVLAVEKAATTYNPPPCPTCHSAENVVPLCYGYPSEEMVRAAERDEIALGG